MLLDQLDHAFDGAFAEAESIRDGLIFGIALAVPITELSSATIHPALHLAQLLLNDLRRMRDVGPPEDGA
jgi:hypothetical protein